MIKKIDIIRKALVIHQLICFTRPMNLYCLQDLSAKGENETETLKGFEIFPLKPTMV